MLVWELLTQCRRCLSSTRKARPCCHRRCFTATLRAVYFQAIKFWQTGCFCEQPMNFLSSIENCGFSAWVRESPTVWSYPLVIFLHAAGLSMVVGLSSVIDLAILGFAPGLPLAPMTKLYRLIGIGFWMNA